MVGPALERLQISHPLFTIPTKSAHRKTQNQREWRHAHRVVTAVIMRYYFEFSSILIDQVVTLRLTKAFNSARKAAEMAAS